MRKSNVLTFLIVAAAIALPILLFPSMIYCSYKSPFIMPIASENIIVGFRDSYLDKMEQVERKHTGIDIEGEAGENVFASGNGLVTYIGFSPIGGRTLVIRHNEKIKTTYLNLEQILVSKGSQVSQGDRIAIIGAEDDPSSETTHLHFGVIYDDKYLDPEDLLKIDYKSISKFLYLKYIEPDFSVGLNQG
jgi:murein DD-endopeptidase MepM/ murein hydrolase activator NlpD